MSAGSILWLAFDLVILVIVSIIIFKHNNALRGPSMNTIKIIYDHPYKHKHIPYYPASC